ncbi:MAG: hypothetical protein KDC98_11205, partial [Planctomycetes bacterium]|nr:hypothetical protein [Planctomycetota bacterium]
PVFADLPRPNRERGDLEDFSRLPGPERLVELAVGSDPLAIALRARFPSRCARALLAALVAGPLDRPRVEALRELADPFVLEAAGRALGGRGALVELLGLWRGDLPFPAALEGLLHGAADDRFALAVALAGRRDSGSMLALADLLLDEASSVRRAAGGSLATTTKDTVAYDADWPRSRRFLAAERVRAMHNRGP